MGGFLVTVLLEIIHNFWLSAYVRGGGPEGGAYGVMYVHGF